MATGKQECCALWCQTRNLFTHYSAQMLRRWSDKQRWAPARSSRRQQSAASKHNAHNGVCCEVVPTLNAGESGRVLRPAKQHGRPAAAIDYGTRHLTMYTVYAIWIV